MSATLTVPVSEDAMGVLREYAAAAGSTPEAVIADYIASLARPLPQRPSNLLRSAGTFHTDDPHAAERVDEILGDALLEELGGRSHD